MATMLQHLRETADLTQRDLARRAGIAQETLSQLESGKSARPRLDTLTKLRDALELDDLRPEDLLHPNPLADDAELAPAAERLINLLKVLPHYSIDSERDNKFWEQLSEHLGYLDLYPARKISSHLQAAMDGSGRDWRVEVDLAQYVLMFFDPEDRETLKILADRGGVGPGPGVTVARLWCREVIDAAWIIHRATLTSYPEQVGQLYMEAGESSDPARIAELCQSVYAIVRSRALLRAPVADQIIALKNDPSDDVRYEIAKSGEADVQAAALDVPAAWVGLAQNDSLRPAVMQRLTDAILDRLDETSDDSPAHRALFDLCERTDLTRPLAEKISAAIDVDNKYRDGGWITSSVLAIRSTLDDMLRDDAAHAAQPRPRLHAVAEPTDRPSWWRRFLTDHNT